MDFKGYLKQQELSITTAEMYHYQAMNFISFLDKDNTQVEICTERSGEFVRPRAGRYCSLRHWPTISYCLLSQFQLS